MKPDFGNTAENSQQRRQNPCVQRRMRKAAHVDQVALKNVSCVVGMQRIDLGMPGAIQIVRIVALNRLAQEGKTQQEHNRDDKKAARYHCTGTPGWSVHTSVSGI